MPPEPAIPVATGRPPQSAAVPPPGGRGLLRVVSPGEVTDSRRTADVTYAKQQGAAASQDEASSQLVHHVRTRWTEMRNHRNSANSGPGGVSLNERLLSALRAFNGQYSAAQLQSIRQFGGSEVYARIIGSKSRGATALLREIYLGPEKPWGLEPTPEPVIPDNVEQNIVEVLSFEVDKLMQSGQPVDQLAVRARAASLLDAARQAARQNASKEAAEADRRLDDLLVEGNFYQALAEFLIDLPLFPFACIKGPVVKYVWDLTWTPDGKPLTTRKARMFWERISPFDLYWSPGANKAGDTEFIERQRVSRASLSEVMDLPGYNRAAIEEVLEAHGRGGLADWMDSIDSERAQQEGRENPWLNRSHMIDCAEYHGSVQAKTLVEYGFSQQMLGVDSLQKEVSVQAWLIDKWVIKVQMTPSPRRRAPYYVTSWEKVPGTIAGNALPDVLEDIQSVCNASLRALVNNQAMASGPQVEVQVDRIAPGTDMHQLYPWKRWYVTSDPVVGTTEKPAIKFWQANSHAQELLGIYQQMTNIGDELSAIPKYITGSDRLGGAGRTASGLAMLMGNANKILQTVADNIDRDVMEPCLQGLYDMVMLADAGVRLRGDENIRVRGVGLAQKREIERQRQLEFLRIITNPVDMQIIGMEGRSKLLKALADGIGLEGDQIVPDIEQLKSIAGKAVQPGVMPPGMMPDGGAGMPGTPSGPGGPPGLKDPASQQAPPGAPGGPEPTNLVQ